MQDEWRDREELNARRSQKLGELTLLNREQMRIETRLSELTSFTHFAGKTLSALVEAALLFALRKSPRMQSTISASAAVSNAQAEIDEARVRRTVFELFHRKEEIIARRTTLALEIETLKQEITRRDGVRRTRLAEFERLNCRDLLSTRTY